MRLLWDLLKLGAVESAFKVKWSVRKPVVYIRLRPGEPGNICSKIYKPILLYYIQIISCTTKLGIVLAGAVQLVTNKALFQTVFILNKQGGKDNRCTKVKQCVKGIRAGESPHVSRSSAQSWVNHWLWLQGDKFCSSIQLSSLLHMYFGRFCLAWSCPQRCRVIFLT